MRVTVYTWFLLIYLLFSSILLGAFLTIDYMYYYWKIT